MAKVSPLQSDFSGGEFSGFLDGRVDSDRYKKSLKICKNYIPTVQGPLTRRPGTKFVFPTKDNGIARLQGFEFSTEQAYILEFGHQYVRFFKDNANIVLAPQNISAITQANPAVVTYSGADTYANGDRIVIGGVSGMTQVNNREFIVANVNTGANTFELSGIDSTGFDAYTSGGTISEIYEIATDFDVSEIFDLKFTQSADVLYVVHPDHPPKKLIRHDHADWEIMDLDFQDGPYLPTNTTNTTLTPSAATGDGITITSGPNQAITNAADNGAGNIRITSVGHGFFTGQLIFIDSVTGTTEANGTWTIVVIDADTFDLRGSTFVNAYVSGGTASPALFASTDVGRLIRMKQGTVWGWAKIVTYISPIQVTADVKSTLTSTAAKLDWRLGLYSETTGYPAAITFHEDRLMFGGVPSQPQRQDGSKSSNYEVFSPTELDGTVSPDNAIAFSFNSNDVNAIRWMVSDEKGLLSGTVAGEWVTRPSSQSEALSPTNITAKRSTSWGSENIQPVQAGKATLFVQRAGRKIREMSYYFDVDGFRSTDLTQLADHILPTGIKQAAYQKEPQSIVWCVRNDGVLAGLGYDRDLDALRAGWHRHILGGVSDDAGSDPIVESVQVIPSADGRRQDTWVIVQRKINGGTKRYIEYLTKLFEDTDVQRDAFFVDSGLTFDAPVAITNITKANPAVVTAAGHGLSNGDKILIVDVKGMGQVNGQTYLAAGVSGATFQLHTLLDAAVDSTGYDTYVSGGEVRKLVTTISSLNHLEGQTVDILADGAVQPSKTVVGGKITLQEKAATIHLGFGYNSDVQLLRFEAGAADGTALGKTRRTHRIGVFLYRSLGLKIGYNFDELDTITFRKTSDPLTRAVPLFTGIIGENTDADYDFDNNFCIRQAQPLPSTILAIMPQMVTQDRG